MTNLIVAPEAAQKALDDCTKILQAAGFQPRLIQAKAHEDVRNGERHQTYIHIEAWATGPGLARELDAIDAEAEARIAADQGA